MDLAEVTALRARVEAYLILIDEEVGKEHDLDKAFTPEMRQEAESLLQLGRDFCEKRDEFYESEAEKASWGKAGFDESEGNDDEDESDIAVRPRGDSDDSDRKFIAEEVYRIRELTRPIEEAALELTNIACDMRELEEYLKEKDSA